MARIVIDLDGVICNIRKKEQTYRDVRPIQDVVEKIKKLKAQGHYIIINTARHMVTTSNNIGLINRKIGKTTLEWLDKNNILYDEIIFAKPYGDIYIDDSALKFNGWDTIDEDGFNENKINIVIPMAGIGKRFLEAGYETPKPLIKCRNKYMFEWALKSFEIFNEASFKLQYIFIVLREHIEKWNIETIIREKYPEAIIIPLNSPTQGQAETVLKAKKYINNINKLIIFNSDTYSICPDLLKKISETNVHGIIPCFEDNNPLYSYVKTDTYGNIIDVAEKKLISKQASSGMYYFKKGNDYIWTAEEMINNNATINKEYYIIPTYKKLAEVGRIIKIASCEQNWVLGTPEELKIFEQKFLG